MSENVTAQSPTTAGCRIDVREYGQAYIARAAGLNITASCTCSAKAAAERCADKVFGAGNWECLKLDGGAFGFTRKGPAGCEYCRETRNLQALCCAVRNPEPPHYACTRLPGHEGPHVACSDGSCQVAAWRDESEVAS